MNSTDLSRLLSGTTVVLVANVVGSSAKLVERVILGRMLSPTAYGDVSVGLALLSFGSVIALGGFTESIPRFVPRFDQSALQRGIWLVGIVVTGGFTGVMLLAVYLLEPTLVERLFEGAYGRSLLWLFMLSIPAVVATRVTAAAIRGHGNAVFFELVEDLAYPIVRISLLVVLLLVGYTATAAGYAYLLAAVFTFLLAHVLLNRIVPLVGTVELRVRELLVFSLPLMVATTSIFLLHSIDTLMLGYYRSSRLVAVYNVSYPLAMSLATVLQSFGIFFLPLVSELDAADERTRIRSLYRVTTKWMYVTTFPVFLVFVAFPEDVIQMIFGSGYAGAGTVLIILSLGFFVRVVFGLNQETLMALGHTRHIMYANTIALLGNVALNITLIPAYGAVGAAIASALSFLYINLHLSVILWVSSEITPLSMSLIRTVLSTTVVLIPVAVLSSSAVALTLTTLVGIAGTAVVATVLVVVASGGLHPADEIILDHVEDTIGIRLPYVRRFF